ncbi:hypothetical protein PRZ61_10930 [Halomonas pacifica]|uniref:hypothetical protein n=1 Tax=Bisbaumannia pacifica TaxID=77098 RepID=UPI002359D05C|nr:hypothetical protein [Halomonas pacifica]MDC8803950.1 hypothetical protein [Halomonas pacifica]
MKKINATAFLAIILSIGVASAGEFSDETDRFSGVRSVVWRSIPPKGEFSVSLSAHYSEQESFPSYYLTVLTWGDGWRYLDCRSNIWLLDGVREPRLDGEYENDMTNNGSTIERFSYQTGRDVLESLAVADLAEFRICNDESFVSQEDMQGIRQVLSATE